MPAPTATRSTSGPSGRDAADIAEVVLAVAPATAPTSRTRPANGLASSAASKTTGASPGPAAITTGSHRTPGGRSRASTRIGPVKPSILQARTYAEVRPPAPTVTPSGWLGAGGHEDEAEVGPLGTDVEPVDEPRVAALRRVQVVDHDLVDAVVRGLPAHGGIDRPGCRTGPTPWVGRGPRAVARSCGGRFSTSLLDHEDRVGRRAQPLGVGLDPPDLALLRLEAVDVEVARRAEGPGDVARDRRPPGRARRRRSAPVSSTTGSTASAMKTGLEAPGRPVQDVLEPPPREARGGQVIARRVRRVGVAGRAA